MNPAADAQRGGAALTGLVGLLVVVVAAAIVKGCLDDGTSGEERGSLPPAPAVPVPLPAPPPPVVVEHVPPPASAPRPAPAFPVLVVHNPCQQPLLLAVNFESADGARVNEGFFRIDPGGRLTPSTHGEPIELRSKTIYYYTETMATEPVELGRRDETVGDRQVAMKRIDLDPPAMTTIVLECPGMTGGRP